MCKSAAISVASADPTQNNDSESEQFTTFQFHYGTTLTLVGMLAAGLVVLGIGYLLLRKFGYCKATGAQGAVRFAGRGADGQDLGGGSRWGMQSFRGRRDNNRGAELEMSPPRQVMAQGTPKEVPFTCG